MASQQKKKQQDRAPKSNCCPPRAMAWIDMTTSQIQLENRIQQQTRLDVRAANSQSMPPPPPQGMVQNATSDSELDQTIFKDQGKVYRTDQYTIHWQADGQCRPLTVALSVSGEVSYRADCLPEEGRVQLSRAYLMEPPTYALPADRGGQVQATLTVTDCAGQVIACTNLVQRA